MSCHDFLLGSRVGRRGYGGDRSPISSHHIWVGLSSHKPPTGGPEGVHQPRRRRRPLKFSEQRARSLLAIKPVPPCCFSWGHSCSMSCQKKGLSMSDHLWQGRRAAILNRSNGGGQVNLFSSAQLNLTFLNKFTTQYNYWWNLFPRRPPLKRIGGGLQSADSKNLLYLPLGVWTLHFWERGGSKLSKTLPRLYSSTACQPSNFITRKHEGF